MNFCFGDKRRLKEETGIGESTAKRRRLSGEWVEGVHWTRMGERKVLFNLPLIKDWLINRNHPDMHQRAIELYLTSLPSNQPQKRGRKGG